MLVIGDGHAAKRVRVRALAAMVDDMRSDNVEEINSGSHRDGLKLKMMAKKCRPQTEVGRFLRRVAIGLASFQSHVPK